ncbi:hypothetical protein SJ05684_c19790 [Sinorhizobium sojae CCBAU 05684]|uniref:Uncharacterized protein n=1 Tax=Sinorhizobium sojae CCBAU 05684 TaxID=716928 RepID=A0A249PBX9_9HYPH|nr:hypothetical protein SJ05684_c19790 [Sinorhizobium sojae CCBAU 05684]
MHVYFANMQVTVGYIPSAVTDGDGLLIECSEQEAGIEILLQLAVATGRRFTTNSVGCTQRFK